MKNQSHSQNWTKYEIWIKTFGKYTTIGKEKNQVGEFPLDISRSKEHAERLKARSKRHYHGVHENKLQSQKIMPVWIWRQEKSKTEVNFST